jgi:hypothetical protein
MESVYLLGTLLLPWLLGVVWLRVGWRRAPAGAWATSLGYGYLLGTLFTTLAMRLWDALGFRQDFHVLPLALCIVLLLGLWLSRGVPWKGWAGGWLTQAWREQLAWQKAVFTLLLLVLAMRFAGLTLEVLWRPLYPWDAFVHWAPKARVWYELRYLVPFESPQAWLARPDNTAYTSIDWNYPPTIPLIQLWTALAFPRWDDALINLPWVACAVALGLAFYGQARIWGVKALPAMTFTYMLLSLPFLNAQVALAGYAELWLAAVYGLAAMALFLWLRTRDPRQGVMALLLALACTQIKVPGLVWALTLVPALLAVLPRKGLRVLLALLACAALTIVLAGGLDVTLPVVGRVVLSLHGLDLPDVAHQVSHFHPVWEPFVQNDFVLANWHLFWYLWWGLLILALPRLFSSPWLPAMTAVVISAFAFQFTVFFFTPYFQFALDYTTINRAVFHMVPMLTFYGLVLLHEAVFPTRRCASGEDPRPEARGWDGLAGHGAMRGRGVRTTEQGCRATVAYGCGRPNTAHLCVTLPPADAIH